MKKTIRKADTLFARVFIVFTLGFLCIVYIGSLHAEKARRFYSLYAVIADHTRRIGEVVSFYDFIDMPLQQKTASSLTRYGITLSESTFAPDLSSMTKLNKKDVNLEEIHWSVYSAFSLNAAEYLNISKKIYGKMLAQFFTFLDMPCDGLYYEVLEAEYPSLGEMMYSRLYMDNAEEEKPQNTYSARVIAKISEDCFLIFEDRASYLTPASTFPFGGIFLTGMFFTLLCLLIVYMAVRPLRRLAKAADRLGYDIAGAPPLPEDGPKEVREASQAFNRMQKAIRDFINERTLTIAALSHDLRTPLTRLLLRAEMLEEPERSRYKKDMAELGAIMDSGIDLAKSTSEEVALLDMASLLESMVEDRKDSGQDVTIEDAAAVASLHPLLARPTCVRRCLGNLLDNAIRYGQNARISVSEHPAFLEIVITDSGPGIREDFLERVFEPYFRVEPSRNRNTGGTGLGLSIARNMARLHGGDIRLSNAATGGLRATIIFSRAWKPATL